VCKGTIKREEKKNEEKKNEGQWYEKHFSQDRRGGCLLKQGEDSAIWGGDWDDDPRCMLTRHFFGGWVLILGKTGTRRKGIAERKDLAKSGGVTKGKALLQISGNQRWPERELASCAGRRHCVQRWGPGMTNGLIETPSKIKEKFKLPWAARAQLLLKHKKRGGVDPAFVAGGRNGGVAGVHNPKPHNYLAEGGALPPKGGGSPRIFPNRR